ncbi:hypothetical protein PTI98_000187 [Pleurotus ostreatus]|nr:hypothetical protein PTI98_000187 [Pleurotus ostreatus]
MSLIVRRPHVIVPHEGSNTSRNLDFFISAPFYNGPQITDAIKTVLKDDYNYDSTPSFYALWRSFTQCLFIEEDEDIAFYKNKHGEALRVVDQEYERKNVSKSG